MTLAWRDAYGGPPPGISDQIIPPGGNPVAEVQLAICLAHAAGVSAVAAFRAVAAAGTFGDLCEQVAMAMAQPDPNRPIEAATGSQPEPAR